MSKKRSNNKNKVITEQLYIIPLFEEPFLPTQTEAIIVDAEVWNSTVNKINNHPDYLGGFVYCTPEDIENITTADFKKIGTIFKMHNPVKEKNDVKFIAEGLKKFKIKKWLSKKPPYKVEISYPAEKEHKNIVEIKAYTSSIVEKIHNLLPLKAEYKKEIHMFLNRYANSNPSDLGYFALTIATNNADQLQQVLEINDLKKRLKTILDIISEQLKIKDLKERISLQVEEKISKKQHEFFLREQLKEIQQELDIENEHKMPSEEEIYREKLNHLEIIEKYKKKIDNEINKFSSLEKSSPEYIVARNYLDILTTLPWGKYSKDKVSVTAARKTLNNEHEALDDVKDRIIEFIATGALKGDISGSIILLVGPPGVGKTSIGKSIASAVGRHFYRLSVGGMRDEAEIKGHRRTYIGAMPGKIIKALINSEYSNPVIMIDEIDKIGSSYQGDPASALLEVLDPEQNNQFLDYYLDMRYDLSKVLFICTANQLDTIPQALLDRMEAIHLPGYILEEKVSITKKHLWPKLLKRSGVKSSKIKLSNAALKYVIDGYAREAGVRGLEQMLARIIRKAAVKIVKNKKNNIVIKVTQKDVDSYLGMPTFYREEPFLDIGVMIGLAWTIYGGETINIETSVVHSQQRGIKVTGNLGDVMKESAEIAFSYISANLKKYKAQEDFFDNAFVHMHIPEGATPKDGPSAGITMAASLLSLAYGKKLDRKVAMTGELTLTGQILAVGGIREKVIAAKRIGINEIILPHDVEADYKELPKYIKKGLKVHFADHFEDVANILFPEIFRL